MPSQITVNVEGHDTTVDVGTTAVELFAKDRAVVVCRVDGEPPTGLATLQDSSGDFGETGIYAAAAPDNTTYGLGLSDKTAVREDGSLAAPRSWRIWRTEHRPTWRGPYRA